MANNKAPGRVNQTKKITETNMLKTDYKFSEVLPLASQIESDADRVKFNSILATDNGGVSLVAFSKGQKLDEHVAPAELMVVALEGEIVFTVADKPNLLRKGDFILVGKDVRHSVSAKADSKMMLIKMN